MVLLLPWRSSPTSGHANSSQVLCDRKRNPFPIPCRFACTRAHNSKNTCRRVDAIAFQVPGNEEVLVNGNVCDSIIISDFCKRGNGNTHPLLCQAGHTDTGSSSVRFAKRAFIAYILTTVLTCGCVHFDNLPPFLQNCLGLGVAHASLVQMPPEFLNNRYYLVRAGESEFESIGVINTNPVTKTNVESGLSENGKKQTVKAALQLREMGACDGSCWVWPSITQRAYQAAEIIAYFNNINRSRIVPEYSFLDARGLGAYEGKSLSFLSKVYESDAESTSLRPPAYTDGTPNESVADVFVRVTQLMSVLETQYFGESIIIVAPDSDNLSILQAALTGLDLRRHSVLAFVPGEVRYVDLDDRPPQSRARPSGLVKCKTPSQCG